MKFNANDTLKRAEEDYGLGKGQYFKVQEGANKIRLLSPAIPHKSEYKGQVNVKFVAWIIDRRDGKVKLYFMPTTILNAIGGLQMSDDFGFEEVPMPYDITIVAKGAGTKEVEYTVVGARNNTPLTPEEEAEFNSKPSIDEVLAKLSEKQGSSGEAEPEQGKLAESPPPTGYEKARQMADNIKQNNQQSANQYEDVKVEDIPF